jgi:hypothetical protein
MTLDTFLNVAIILIILATIGWGYVSIETEKYWRERMGPKPPGQK